MKEDIISLKKELSDHEIAIFNTEMEKYKKNTGVAYLLWIFLGTLGIHKFYIGKIGMGILYLVLGIGAWISLILGLVANVGKSIESASFGSSIATGMILFFVLIAIVGIMLLIDVFTIPKQIRKVYEKKEVEILKKLTASKTTND